MTKTTIEWTDESWNPVTGCTKVSPGCDRCYAENIAHRFAGTAAFPNGFEVTLRPERLHQPLHWQKPRRVFVNSMSDLFHEDVPDDYIANVWATMALSPRHTFQVLTKRHARMRSLLNSESFKDAVLMSMALAVAERGMAWPPEHGMVWPRPNIWLGVSTENQQWADIRIPAMLETPAAVRFVSAEPLLGPLDLSRWLGVGAFADKAREVHAETWVDRLALASLHAAAAKFDPTTLDWVIVGGESGPGARPMHPNWVRSLRDQCEKADTPFFFKQWGAWVGHSCAGEPDGTGRSSWHGTEPLAWVRASDGAVVDEDAAVADGGDFTGMWRVGAKVAGRDLDGQSWDQYPQKRNR